jgi:hypothetical protein
MSFVYLASPYTPTGTETIADRVDAACKYAAKLMNDGYSVFSPIVHSHYVADHLDEAKRLDHEFWMQQDLAILRSAAKVIVLRLPGWDRSRGIAREIEAAKGVNIPVEFHEYS